MTSLHFHPLRVSALQPDAQDAQLLSFDVPPELDPAYHFQPGQYLNLRAVVGGEELRRSYSICTGPGEPLRVGVRRVPGGVFSNWLHDSLKVGDTLDVMPPDGRFGWALTQAQTRPRHVLAVAGGSGITPMLAILKATLAQDPHSRCSLLYGNRSAASTMFKEELEDLKNRCMSRLAMYPVFSREVMDTPLQSGRLDADKMASLMRLIGRVDVAFVCGPHAMNDEVEAALLAAGLQPEQVHVERFGVPANGSAASDHNTAVVAGTAAAPVSDAFSSVSVSIVRDGLTREIDFRPEDGNLLAAAARAGLEVPFSCRSGVCATCRAKLLEGQVRMARNFALEADQVAAGFVLSCQTYPLTERVVISFDER